MKLSKNFVLSEFLKSQTALRFDIDNIPNSEQIANLQSLVTNVLQPIRDHFKKSVTINSGFRCLELNRKIGSSDSSQHTKGMAADIEIPGISNKELAEWIRDNLEFDQLILEFYKEDDPQAGWVHLSYFDEDVHGLNMRMQCLTISKDGTRYGLG